jgi:hypothetical protein
MHTRERITGDAFVRLRRTAFNVHGVSALPFAKSPFSTVSMRVFA